MLRNFTEFFSYYYQNFFVSLLRQIAKIPYGTAL